MVYDRKKKAKPAGPSEPKIPGYPFKTQCRHCGAALTVKTPAMVGKRVDCPKCGKKIEIVSPDEDASINYGVEAAPEPEPEPEPTEEELEQEELELQKKKRKLMFQQIKWTLLTLVYLSGFCFAIYLFIYAVQNNTPTDKKEPGQVEGL